MLDLIRDINAYLSRPYVVSIPKQVDRPFVLLFRLVFICVFAGISAGIISGVLINLKLIPDPGPSVLDKKSMSQLAFFIGAVLTGPVMEELVFRTQLRRFTGNLLFIAFMVGTLLTAITGTEWAYLISPFVFLILFLLYRLNLGGSITKKYQFWDRMFPWHFHLTAICFALIHLSNFEKGIDLLPFGIVYTLPQLAIGLVLGYTRMNYGLKYSIALHSLYNLIFTLLLFVKQ